MIHHNMSAQLQASMVRKVKLFENGFITEVAELQLTYQNHMETELFAVTNLGKENLLLGHTWLRKHNPEINWTTGDVRLTRCIERHCKGCQEVSRERKKAARIEDAAIFACRTGPHPSASIEDEEEEEDSTEPIPEPSDLPFDLEDGDRMWATGLLLEAKEIRAT